MNNASLKAIKETYKYPALLAVREYVDDLAKNCFSLYDSFKKAVEDDEARNEQLKSDFREYNYKRSYSAGCTIQTKDANFHSENYDNYEAFSSALNNDIIQGVSKLTIELDMSFRAGKESALADHNHKFTISLEPGNSTLEYAANYSDQNMENIRDSLIKKLESFPSTRTIFSEKQ